MQLCEYGCGQEAKYQLKNGKWCCSKNFQSCPEIKRKNSEKIKLAHKDGRIYGWGKLWKDGKNYSWNKGLTKKTSESIRKGTEKFKEGLKSGRFEPAFKNKHHKLESRQKLSNTLAKKKEDNLSLLNGFIKTKYYKVFCPYENKDVSVQGTWELKYAQYLNKNHIKWIRNRKHNIKYRLSTIDIIRTYYPDFYLPETDEYIEIKGFFFKSGDGKFDDELKMNAIYEQHPELKIKILQKVDLQLLGIDIKYSNNLNQYEFIKTIHEKFKLTWCHDRVYVVKDPFRKISENALHEYLIKERRKLLDESKIDLMKFGWVGKVANLWNISHTQVKRWIKNNYKDLTFFERN